jgi:sugar-specific transcriptional regulator TrmB
MKCSRTEAYRLLRSLADRGFAITTLDRPVRFTSRSLGHVIERLLNEEGAKIHAIEAARSMIPILDALRAEPSTDIEKSKFRIIVGRPEIFKAIMHVVSGARTDIRAIMTHLSSTHSTDYSGIWELLDARLAEGVQVRVLRSPHKTSPATHLAQRTRTITTSKDVRFIICDDHEMVIFAVSDPTARVSPDEEVAIVTTAPDMVFAESLLFEELWHRSAGADTAV